jgi:drug/metabolite transporter (DMT)-like permease
LPLGDLYVLLNLAPIIITASAAIILKETVGWRRWSAVIIGFMGVVIVINPTKLEFGFAFIFPLLAALLIAYRDTYTRQFQFKFDSIQIAFVTSLVVTIIFGIFMLFHFVPMTFKEFIFIVCSAILLAFGYICAVATIKIATMSTTSTFRYTVIIWGIMYGYFFFNEIPSLNMIIGSSIVVASGLFIIYRQKKIGIIN